MVVPDTPPLLYRKDILLSCNVEIESAVGDGMTLVGVKKNKNPFLPPDANLLEDTQGT